MYNKWLLTHSFIEQNGSKSFAVFSIIFTGVIVFTSMAVVERRICTQFTPVVIIECGMDM